MLYYVRYNFKKYGQLFELVNNNLDLFDANIFQKTQESTILVTLGNDIVQRAKSIARK